MPPQQEHLIDVRSPSEFALGHLASDIAPTINIEYQSIASLATIYAQKGIPVTKNDHITLYCRSGRRSDIALKTLRELGYQNVRDIGGFEEARRVLDKEMVERQLEEGMEMEMGMGVGGLQEEGGKGEGDEKRHVRVESFGALVEGLKRLEE